MTFLKKVKDTGEHVVDLGRNARHHWDHPSNTVNPTGLNIAGEVARRGIAANPLLVQCQNGGPLFDIRRLNAARINAATIPHLEEVTNALRVEGRLVEAQVRTPAGRITGRKKHDAFGQEVHAVTSAAGWLGAYSTNNAANEQAFTRLLQVCPDPTIKELAKSYRVDPYISAQIIQNVVPAIAAHIRNRDTEISTKELLAAGSTLIALWCRGNATLKQVLKQGFTAQQMGTVTATIENIRSQNLRACRDALKANHGALAAAAGAPAGVAAAEATLSVTLAANLAVSFNAQQQANGLFAGLDPILHQDIIAPIENMVGNPQDCSLVAVMLCAGLMKFGVDKAKKYHDVYENIQHVLQLAGAAVALSTVAAPAGVAFIVGDILAHHMLEKKEKEVMSRINDIRTSIMSAAYDAGYEPYINAEFMMHFDMAMGGMGFWPVYDKVK